MILIHEPSSVSEEEGLAGRIRTQTLIASDFSFNPPEIDDERVLLLRIEGAFSICITLLPNAIVPAQISQ